MHRRAELLETGGSSHRNKDLRKTFNYSLCVKEVSLFKFAGVEIPGWFVLGGRWRRAR